MRKATSGEMRLCPWVTYRAASLWQTTPLSVMTSLSLSSRWTLPCKGRGWCHEQTRLVFVPEGAKPGLRHKESGCSPLTLCWLRGNGPENTNKGHTDTWPLEVLRVPMSRACDSETRDTTGKTRPRGLQSSQESQSIGEEC